MPSTRFTEEWKHPVSEILWRLEYQTINKVWDLSNPETTLFSVTIKYPRNLCPVLMNAISTRAELSSSLGWGRVSTDWVRSSSESTEQCLCACSFKTVTTANWNPLQIAEIHRSLVSWRVKDLTVVSMKVLSRDCPTIDGVWIGNWIYWTLTERNYK
jgi:hypothetical protein